MPEEWGIPKEELLKMPGYRQPKDEDIAAARRLLAEVGYPEGFRAKSLVRAQKEFEDYAVFVADQVAKIGIQLELDVKEQAMRNKLVDEGAFSNHATRSCFAYPDPLNVARNWAAPVGDYWANNWQRARDEKIFELFDRQSRAVDPGERKKIVRELDLRLIEFAARPTMFWIHYLMAMWPEVKNRGIPVGVFSFNKYQDVWLAK